MIISAVSLKRRVRPAAEAPSATPPTIMIFNISPTLKLTTLYDSVLGFANKGQAKLVLSNIVSYS